MQNFINPNDPKNEGMKIALRKWIGEKLGTSDFQFDIGEHHCTDSSCLHSETVLEIRISGGEMQRMVIPKPLVFVRKWDIKDL
jgi:hypothetical protein